MNQDRLRLLTARTLRSEHFRTALPGVVSSGAGGSTSIVNVDQLPMRSSSSAAACGRGAGAAREPLTLMGVISQPEVGVFCLEDSTKAVALDLRAAETTPGFYTEGSFVIAQGVYDADGTYLPPGEQAAAAVDREADGMGGGEVRCSLQDGVLPGVFRVSVLGSPPLEPRAKTLAAMSCVDPFRVIETPAELDRVSALERGLPRDTMVVFASNIHLDEPAVHVSLRQLLQGYSAAPRVPEMFVFCGNFCSRPFGQQVGDAELYRGYFDDFARILGDYPAISRHARIVLVPGPADPGAGRVLPRFPLPAAFAGPLLDKARFPHLVLASNPCRIRFFTQEIVVFRSEITTRLRKRAILTPVPASLSLRSHMAHTLLLQGHLCPLPMSVQPIYWEYDHALRLHPAPTLLVIPEEADDDGAADGAAVRLGDTQVANPGSFARDAQFAVYYPATGVVEASQL
jgi:DNA polymerase epsilon subunit 2